MKLPQLYLLLLLATLVSCKKDVSPVETGNEPPIFAEPLLNKILFTRVDYDKYAVRHADGMILYSNNVVAIVVGEIDSTGFHVQDSITSTYDDIRKKNRLIFNVEVPFSRRLLTVTLRVRYYHPSGSWSDYDSTFSALKYPYPGTELVWHFAPHYVEDVDIADSVFYGQASGYILKYDSRTGVTSKILVDSYEVLTVANNQYLFYDDRDWSLYRFDFTINYTERFVYHPSGRFMRGLESFDGTLYELLDNGNQTGISLLSYSSSGELLDSIAMQYSNLSRLTIHDGVAYFQQGWEPGVIRSFDLTSKAFIGQFKSPAYNYESLRIRDGYVYYSDFDRRAVGRFPFDELFTYGVVDPSAAPAHPRGKPPERYEPYQPVRR